MKRITSWLDKRFGLGWLIKKEWYKPLPPSTNWLFSLGSVALFLFVVQILTGIFLALYYVPTPDHAYESVQFINEKVIFGKLLRGIHSWGAGLLMIILPLHLLRVFFYGAYKKPRETTWMAGVLLLGVTFTFAFTGYLLPWDEKGFWATVVGTNIAGSPPVLGKYVATWLKGGVTFGALTLSRFYAIHVLLLPATFLVLVSVHLYLVLKHNTAGHWDPQKNDFSRGFPFYPIQVGRDALAALVVLAIVGVLAFVKPPHLLDVANPSNTSFIPRPEWYFLFHFQLLKYFPGSSRVIATVILPTLFFLALILLPFYDRRPRRSPLKRPVALTLASLTVVSVITLTVLAIQEDVRLSGFGPKVPLNAVQKAGLEVFNTYGCKMCHGEGGYPGSQGPSLIDATTRHDQTWLMQHFKDPQSLVPGSKMPKFDYLSDEELAQLLAYLQTVK